MLIRRTLARSLRQSFQIACGFALLLAEAAIVFAGYDDNLESLPPADSNTFYILDPSRPSQQFATPAAAIEPYAVPNSPQQFTYPSPAPAAIPTVCAPPGNACAVCQRESAVYTRIDYFHWNERVDGADFVNEYGPLWTIGLVHRTGRERFRAEMFSGVLNYSADIEDNFGNVETLSSETNYLGVRGEFELLFEPENTPNLTFFVGLGTRFWVRDLPDDFTQSGIFVWGYQETWWTFYPYVGLERRRMITNDWEFYGMGRIGLTAITLERISDFDIALYPQPGVTGQLEGGFRGKHLFVSAFFEAMGWRESPVVRGVLQPTSMFTSVGLRTGCSF